jgi:hypothetical protein
MNYGLEYLVGRKIEGVVVPLKKEKKGYNWSLLIEGGVKVHNLNDTPRPDNADVENTTMGVISVGPDDSIVQLFSGSPAAHKGTLVFTEYDIEYPAGNEPNIPRRQDPEEDRPADPSHERVVEGPEQ